MKNKLEQVNGITRVMDVVARLRGEDGCPWDRQQTLDSLKPCLMEECCELLEAIEQGDVAAHPPRPALPA